MKKLALILLSLTLTFSLVISGCASKAPDAASSAPAASGDATAAPKAEGKAACVLGVGGLGDQSYNDLVYAGMNKAKDELGIEFDYAEPKQISDFELIIRDMASSGEYSVIVSVGFDQVDPLIKIAPEFPGRRRVLRRNARIP